ncbi:hypothetical protein NL676_005592 [Syzygium grande]|nr:hypothetical protein NL676_005592 [Syzygium grande]
MASIGLGLPQTSYTLARLPLSMDSPLLSPRTETWETRVNIFALSPEGTPSDEQQYRKSPSIYRVPGYITNLNPKAHKPQVVSFGPYHHDEVHLRPMEEHKDTALHHFLKRSGKSRALFLESLREVEQDLRRATVRWTRSGRRARRTNHEDRDREECGYPNNHPIFNKRTHIKPYIRRDMLMLENQLPMLVLYQLVAVENNGMERDEYINQLILRFYSLWEDRGMGRCLHVVDIYRKGLLTKKVQHEETKQTCWSAIKQKFGLATEQNDETKPATKQTKETEQIIRSATELNETGIQFKKSPTNSLKDITFARGVLKLPVIMVDDATESMFLNLMTFERLHIEAGKEISSYIAFMNTIINDRRDVALLHTEGIIQHAMGSDKEVAKLFNSLCKEVTLASDSSLDAVQEQISKYCKKPWNKWRADLNHTYFGNPWALVSLLAAIFLFTLTIIQTVYALLSYY